MTIKLLIHCNKKQTNKQQNQVFKWSRNVQNLRWFISSFQKMLLHFKKAPHTHGQVETGILT